MRLLVCCLFVLSAPAVLADDAPVTLSPEAQALVRDLEAEPDARPALEALVEVFEADAGTRIRKIEALGSIADLRLAAPLGYLVKHDREVAAREAAARTLGVFVSPRAETVLRSVASDTREATHVRRAAVASLGRQKTVSAGDALAALAQDLDQDGAVRQAAADALRAHFPELAARLNLPLVIAGSSGRAIATVVGAASGAYALSLVGMMSPNATTGAVVGAFGGLVVGGAAGNLLAHGADLDEGDAQFIGSAGLWSVPVGWSAGRLLGGPTGDCDRGCQAVMLGTHAVAMGGSWLLRDRMAFSTLDAAEVNGVSLASLFVSLGVADLAWPGGDVRPGHAVRMVLPAAAFATASAFADDLRLTAPLAGLTFFAALDGLYLGNALGPLLVPDYSPSGPLGASERNPHADKQRAGLRWLGLGLGLGGVLAGSVGWQPTGSEVQLIGYATVLGHALGGGIPLLLRGREQPIHAVPMAVSGLAAGAAVGLLTRPMKLSLEGGDSLLMPLGLGFAAWQGFGWAMQMKDRGTFDGNAFGLGLTLAATGGVATLALTQMTDLSAWEAGWAFSGAAWGGWLLGWGSYASRAHGSTTLGMALAGSALGLATGAVLVSPLVGVNPTRLAWTSVFGVGGLTFASMIAVFADEPTTQSRTVSTANVVGTAVGLAVGAVVSGWLVEEGVGGDLPSLPGLDLDAPAVAVSPIFEPGSTRMEGLGASLTWAL